MLVSSPIWSLARSAEPSVLAMTRAQIDAARIQIAAREFSDALPVQVAGSVGTVKLHGVMMKDAGYWAEIFSLASTVRVRRAVESLTADDTVKTIVLHIDSPGGSVDGLAELVDAVWAARQVKTVIAQVDGMAASAAYAVASQASKIYLGRMDAVGSIGVRMLIYDWSELFAKEGIRAVPIDTGEFKSAGAMGTEITAGQEADFQRIVDQYFADFLAAVTRGRGITAAALKPYADGRIFLAKEAIKAGLADKVQTLDVTMADLMQRDKSRSRARANANRLAAMDMEAV